MRKKYDHQLKLIYKLGMEKSLISDRVRKGIPRSTASTWRSLSLNDILEMESSDELRGKLFDFVELRNQIFVREKKVLLLQARFINLLVQSIGKKKYYKLLKENKAILIKTISNSSDVINNNIVLRLLGVQPSTYSQWKSEVKHFCTYSSFHLCAKSYPKQLTIGEVNTLRELLIDPNRSHWSISSIHGDAFKKGILTISRASAYKYNKHFKFRKNQLKGWKPAYRPLRASRPDEIWHADISIFVTDDGKKNYIYAIIDNFSRKILEWDISNKSSGYLSMRILRKALRKKDIGYLKYVTDGGPENNNRTIRNFLDTYHASVDHTIALKDIIQSNSMIESVFRTMKSNYLYLKKTKTRKKLLKVMQDFVFEYNELKPHFSLIYYTPSEIYSGMTNTVKTTHLYGDAFKKRYIENKTCPCTVCTCEEKSKNSVLQNKQNKCSYLRTCP